LTSDARNPSAPTDDQRTRITLRSPASGHHSSAVATRYEKTARSFMGVLCLAAVFDWIKQDFKL
jgi:hypothetical protein